MMYRFGGIILAVLFLTACGSSSTDTASSNRAKSQTQGVAETNVVNSVADMTLGDIYYVTFDDNAVASVDFSGVASSTKYTLIVQSVDSSTSNIVITTDESVNFDEKLREAEASLQETKLPANTAFNFARSISKAAINDTRSFNVLRSIYSTSLYDSIPSTVKCVEDHIIVYFDNDITITSVGNCDPSSYNADNYTNLTTCDVATLCDQFESAVASEIAALGEPSDVNADDKVVTLVTLGVNRLGASGGGIITGYFFANDLYATSGSNQMEIIYILAPDPSGAEGTAISKSFAMSNLMPAVVPHELQHAISYNQHVFINGGSTEKSWLNEAISHFSEDLVGFGQENPSRMELFLAYPESTQLAPSSSPDLSERGAGYTFIRYLYERAANQSAFLSALENTSLTGEDNVINAFGSSDASFDEWNEFVRRWAIAIALTNTGISSTAQYQFNDRVLNSTTEKWEGVCLICDADDYRGTLLTGPYAPELTDTNLSLPASATVFYTISSPPSNLTLSGSAGDSLQGILIRIQ